MENLYRVWVGNQADRFSGFTFFLVPGVPESPEQQAADLLTSIPSFDSVWLFAPGSGSDDSTFDELPIWKASRRGPLGVVVGEFCSQAKAA